MVERYRTRKELLERAKWLRRNASWPEKRLWARLRRKQLGGRKFRRQHVFAPFIVDFYCASCSLVVEVDGPVHNKTGQREKDCSRGEYLCEHYDVEVLRFSSTEVFQSLEEVLNTIDDACAEIEGADGVEDLPEEEGGSAEVE